MRGDEVRVDCVASYTQSGCMTCGMESLCCRCREEMQGDEF